VLNEGDFLGWCRRLALAEGNLQKLQMMTMGKIPDGVDPLPSGCSQGGVPAGWLALLGALALGYRRRR